MVSFKFQVTSYKLPFSSTLSVTRYTLRSEYRAPNDCDHEEEEIRFEAHDMFCCLNLGKLSEFRENCIMRSIANYTT
jgi:hypothetical protein